MTRGKVLLCVGVALFAALRPAAAAEKKKPDPFQVKGLDVRVSGPYAHGNLAVFLLHGKDQDTHDYLTLDQGLKAKTVEVSEKKQERVGELQIENKSDRYLFLQEGDRLQGGKQDRIIVTSLVVPPKSGKMTVPAFCVEQSRWRAGAAGGKFGNVSNTVLAPQAVRAASKLTPGGGGQGAVWREVGKDKGKAARVLMAR